MMMLIFIFPSIPAFAQMPPDPLRGLIWGLPLEAVKDHEQALFVGEEEGALAYSALVQPDPDKRRFQVLIEYTFGPDGLMRVRYDIPVSRGDPDLAFDDVMTWQFWLDAVYNQQSEPAFNFRSAAVRADPARWGWSIYRGDASMTIEWADAASTARLHLSGEDYEPSLILTLTARTPAALP